MRGDSIFMRRITDRSWDRDFNGGAVTVTPVSGTGVHDSTGARYELLGGTLILHYPSYPANAPVETVESLFRLGALQA